MQLQVLLVLLTELRDQSVLAFCGGGFQVVLEQVIKLCFALLELFLIVLQYGIRFLINQAQQHAPGVEHMVSPGVLHSAGVIGARY